VPVFTSLAGTATLKATPIKRRRRSVKARSSRRRARPGSVTVRRKLASGRATITLRRLVPGATYRLVLSIRSADGQSATGTATLRVSGH
jgi:hypothetical protein